MKRFFNINLYKEGLRQTRVLGITLAVISGLISAIVPITYIASYYSNEAIYRSTYQLEFFEFTPVLLFIMYLAPLLLVMSLFSFTNKRSSSDFYHSIPHQRTAVFGSFLMAVFTRLAIIIGSTVALCTILCAISPALSISFSFVPYSLFYFLAGSMLITGAALLAKSITGTAFSNIILSGIILFLPRFIMLMFSYVYESILVIADVNTMGMLLNYKYNAAINNIGLFVDGGLRNFEMFTGSIIYTFVLSVIFIAAAFVLFAKRKSETAEKSSPNKYMQHLYRCLITLPVMLLLPSYLVYQFVLDDFRVELIACLIIIIISLIIYFCYELITTKKAKNLIKAVPVLGILIAFNIAFAGTLLVGREVVFSVKPSKDEITGVRIYPETDWNDNTRYYNQLLLEGVYSDSEYIRQTIADELKNTIDYVRQNGNWWWGSGINQVKFEIKSTSDGKFIRKIYLQQSKYERIMDEFSKDSGFYTAATKLPEINNVDNIRVSVDTGRMLDNKTLQNFYSDIWDIYKKEYEKLSYNEKLRHNSSREYLGYTDFTLSEAEVKNPLERYISIYGYYKGEKYQSNYTISEKTPETMKKYIEFVNEYANIAISDILGKLSKKNNHEYYIWGDILGDGYSSDDYYKNHFWIDLNSSGSMDDGLIEKLTAFFNELSADMEQVDANKPIYVITVNKTVQSEKNREDFNYNIYVNLSEEALNLISKINGYEDNYGDYYDNGYYEG